MTRNKRILKKVKRIGKLSMKLRKDDTLPGIGPLACSSSHFSPSCHPSASCVYDRSVRGKGYSQTPPGASSGKSSTSSSKRKIDELEQYDYVVSGPRTRRVRMESPNGNHAVSGYSMQGHGSLKYTRCCSVVKKGDYTVEDNIDIKPSSSDMELCTPGILPKMVNNSTQFCVKNKNCGVQTTPDFRPQMLDNSAQVCVKNENCGVQTTLTSKEISALIEREKRMKLKIEELQYKVSLLMKAQETESIVEFEQKIKNDDICKFYTGFTNAQVSALLRFCEGDKVLCPESDAGRLGAAPMKKRRFTSKQEMLLLLLRLKGGLLLTDIAHRFDVSVGFASTTIAKWLQHLYEKFDSLRPSMFPHRDTTQENLPAKFRRFYNLRVIFDCVEITCEKMKSFEEKGDLYMSAKFLIGFTPSGAVCFVSDVFFDSESDEEIIKQSGFVNYLDEGDVVLAGKGITIQELSGEKHIYMTRSIAGDRLVDHVVERLKNFRIFQRSWPVSMKHNMISKIVFVCACLLNFHDPIAI